MEKSSRMTLNYIMQNDSACDLVCYPLWVTGGNDKDVVVPCTLHRLGFWIIVFQQANVVSLV